MLYNLDEKLSFFFFLILFYFILKLRLIFRQIVEKCENEDDIFNKLGKYSTILEENKMKITLKIDHLFLVWTQ